VLVLGVDGGGTKTLAAVADRSGAVLALATGRETNPLDQPRWRAYLVDTVALALAGLDPAALAGAAFGLPVHGEVADISAEQVAAARTVLPVASVRNDVHSLHEGAFAGGPGVLLLAGTGSMVWAADAAGATARVGGWGDGFGDEGSAHWIGHAALARASQILDGRREGAGFAAAILDAVGVAGGDLPDALLRWFYRHPSRRPAIAALAATVDRLAGDGDPLAAALLDEAADALALHVVAARRILRVTDEWCFVGGVSRSAAMRARLTARLGPPVAPILPPVGGSLWRAAVDAGWAPDRTWISRLAVGLAARMETT
jgi:N-acetylglucosamine kinase-like BadF-type ATPase